MEFKPTSVDGAFVIEPKKIGDERGYFARSWCENELGDAGLENAIKQVNIASSSTLGTLRGLHYQAAPFEEVKIVRCTRGAMFDVVVDLRPDSKTFKQWFGVVLDEDNACALYVPRGCATGYLTLSDRVDMTYTTSEFYAPEAARGVRYDDPAFGIEWPAEAKVFSEQDKGWADFGH